MIAIERQEGGNPGESGRGSAIQQYLKEIEPLLADASRIPVSDPHVTFRVATDDIMSGNSFQILDGAPRDGYMRRTFDLPQGAYTLSEEFSTDWYVAEKKTHELFHSLSGKDIEVDTALPVRDDSSTIEASYWSNWKVNTRTGHRYREEIYPEVVNHLLPELVAARGKHRAVDLFGGDGEFVRLLQHSARVLGSTASLEWNIVDRDPESLNRARVHTYSPFEQLKEQQDGSKLTVHDPLDLTDARKRQRLFRELGPQDLVTVIGGLNSNVVTSEDAYHIAFDISQILLAPGGKCVVTGYTRSLLNRAMFTEMGFVVEKMCVPENIFVNTLPTQFYVLRNPRLVSSGE